MALVALNFDIENKYIWLQTFICVFELDHLLLKFNKLIPKLFPFLFGLIDLPLNSTIKILSLLLHFLSQYTLI